MEHSETVTVARDEDRAIGVITVAFVADPAMRWLYPEPSRYLASFPKLVRAFGQEAFARGSAHATSDFAGAAIWLQPGVHPDQSHLSQVIESTVDARRVPRIFEVFQALDQHHPTEPHWYLPFIGVDAPKQRRGLGSLLLGYALERIDREHKAAYLETANPANIALYQRHGFEVTKTIELPSAPTLFPMVRRAR